jgi:uncharacterized protein
VQTYLERDVRSVSAVHHLQVFRRFLALIASRHGCIMDKSDIAGPLGMSVPSVGRWLDILEANAQILAVPPFFENVGKRLIKSPKVSIADSGLACHLLEISSAADMAVSMLKLARAWKGSGHVRGSLSMVLVHQPRKSAAISRALAPGVQALPLTEFLSAQ